MLRRLVGFLEFFQMQTLIFEKSSNMNMYKRRALEAQVGSIPEAAPLDVSEGDSTTVLMVLSQMISTPKPPSPTT